MTQSNQGNKENKNQSSEEFLKKYLEETDLNKKDIESNSFNKVIKSDASERASDLQYFHFDAKEMPLGIFYPNGTTIMVRPAMVKEIQSYSMVDDTNFHDIVEKMNDLISSCVRVKYADGKMSSYLDIKDGDRFYLVFLIRELTFQKGNSLYVKSKCSCNQENDIELGRSSFNFWEVSEELSPYFDERENVFYFETISDEIFKVSPPNIGIQKSFTEHILNEYNNKTMPNMSFLKIIPFLLGGRNSISSEGIKKKLKDFQEFDMDTFQFLNSAIDKMKFGIKDLKTNCSSCGLEVHTDMTFPNGASGLFVIPDSFSKFIKK